MTDLAEAIREAVAQEVARQLADRPRPPRMYAPREAAELLGISRSELYRSVIPELTVRRVGRRVLIGEAELRRWMERQDA